MPDWGTVASDAPSSQIVTRVPATATMPPSAASTVRSRMRTRPRCANDPSIAADGGEQRGGEEHDQPSEMTVALVGSDDHDAMRPAMNAPSSAPPRKPA